MSHFKTPAGTHLPLLNLRGKEYLEVKWRIAWFREEHPDWSIETSFVELSRTFCLAKAVIKDVSGRILSMGHKTETPEGFPDFIEKAETGAIGRALALIGYGTQFCADDLDEGQRIVDSPVAKTEPGRASLKSGQAHSFESPAAQIAMTPPMAHANPLAKTAAVCAVCGTSLVLAKAGTSWYCPQFKSPHPDGEHSRVVAAKLGEFIEAAAAKKKITDLVRAEFNNPATPDDRVYETTDDLPF